MESENSSNSDDSQSNISSQSASSPPEHVYEDRAGSCSPSASSQNSAPQSPDNNTSGSQSIGNDMPSPEPDDPLSPTPQSPDSSSLKSKSPVDGSCSPERQNNEPLSPSSVSSSSSRASSTVGSPDRQSHSHASSKVSSRSNESDKETKEPHNNYLSDVSDEDSMDNINDDNVSEKSAKEWKSDCDTHSFSKDIILPINGHNNNTDTKIEPNVVNDPEEPLDFEAEDGEDGECDEPKPVKEEAEIEEEKEPEELEEGEVSDEGEHRPEETEPRPICRFYSRGQCTWGASCRFLHPGVADKGNYSMFEMVRPIPPPGGLPFYPPDPYRTHERPLIPGVPIPPIKKEDVPPVESAWERGLRQAKEILKKSNKKKETDIDFEEKKMNLTSNQEEVEKENDYYAQRPTSPTASPAISPPIERFKSDLEARHHRAPLPDAYVDDFIPQPVDFYHHRPEFWPPHHSRPLPHFPPGHPIDFHSAPRRNPYYPYPPPDPYYHPGLKPHHRGLPPKYPPNREVIVQRSEKSYSPQPSGHRNRRDRSSSRPHRGDDWSDPWMRSKSPGGRSKLRGRKKSYTSHSSFSSRSSSSSSATSYSSRSRSRGRSDSISKNRKKVPPPLLRSPGRKSTRKPERIPSPDAFDKKSVNRPINPPVPTNRWSVSPTNTTAIIQPIPRGRPTMPMPPRFAVSKTSGVKSPVSTHTSSSSSSSDSGSGSGSSESSDSSGSESSSEEGGSPKQRKRRGLSPNKLFKKGASSKLQKGQIKLNTKKKMVAPMIVPPVKKEKSAIQGKKRPLESDNEENKGSPPRKKGAISVIPSRREELLKQLKAVEDAIARKKSKVAL